MLELRMKPKIYSNGRGVINLYTYRWDKTQTLVAERILIGCIPGLHKPHDIRLQNWIIAPTQNPNREPRKG